MRPFVTDDGQVHRPARDHLAEQRSRFEAIFNSAVDYAIVVMDKAGTITDWNQGATNILGWSPDEVRGRDLAFFFTPEDRAAGIPEREMRTAVATGRGIDERWHLRKGGERFWANGEVMPLRSAAGDLIGFIKVLRDRTEARLAQERLVASEKRWRELFETMREGFFIADLIRDDHGKAFDCRFLEINDAFAAQSGLPSSSVGRTLRDFAADIDQALIDRFALTVETGTPQTFEIHLRDLHRWVEIRTAKNEGERFSCLFLDITPRKAIEQRLAENDERLQMALSASGMVGLWDWNLETGLLHGDANFARLYGLDPAKAETGLIEAAYQEFVVPEDLAGLRELTRAVFDRGGDFLVEYRLAVPGQPLRWVECKGQVGPDLDGKPTRFSGTSFDITTRKNAEGQKHLLMEELSHRVKNTFAMVQAIAFQTLRDAEPQLSQTLQDRLAALSRAHDMLLQTSWTATTMAALVEKVLRLTTEGDRFIVSGPELEVGSETALSLSLLLHELATNAVKYGALSSLTGKVALNWSVENGQFRLRWQETGGPPASLPTRRGFGSKLIAMGIRGARQSNLRYSETGFNAEFTAPSALIVAA